MVNFLGKLCLVLAVCIVILILLAVWFPSIAMQLGNTAGILAIVLVLVGLVWLLGAMTS